MMETARQLIAQLVENYQRRKPAELRHMNEAQTRHSFIDPLFEALGWDVRALDEVSVEVNVARSRVDYAFRLNRVTRFIVEAKAPHIDLNTEEFVRQAVTYAYSKGVNWAVLTNFKELRVFSAEEGRLFLNLGCQDYLNNLEKLWLLSKPSWESGLFDREATQYGALRPRVPVEKSLFDQLRQWREELFNQIFLHNPGLASHQVDELIQQFLNRLIFIRTAEDRGIEEPRLRAGLHQWVSRGHTGSLLNDLRAIFADFAQSYDSDLFPLLDLWAPIFVEDPTLADIIQGLYQRPKSLAGYDFAAIDADVLGAVYEQYLGHVAEAVKERTKQAERQLRLLGKEEDVSYELTAKKEKRKAQGIYYTPKWVVDYIVRQTVGRFIAERSHDEIINMKILDPACGSGSFLIRAYDELLAYHAKVQGKTPAELGWAERISILTRNIFGVDLDDQAVQIARLNLLLRALAKQELLPGLADNIRRGNSLISGGEAELKPYFGDTWREKRPFNWEQEFPNIMKRGGFDVVIGNPPYVQSSMRGATDEGTRSFLRERYGLSMGRLNTFGFFVSVGLSLLREDGFLGYILPNTFLTQEYYTALRRLVLDRAYVMSIATLDGMPFPQAVVENVIITLRKKCGASLGKDEAVVVLNASDGTQRRLNAAWFRDSHNTSFSVGSTATLLAIKEKMDRQSARLGDLVHINQAIALKHDRSASIFKEAHGPEYKRVLDGRDINRYSLRFPGNYLLYDLDRIHSCKREDIFLADQKILFRRVGDRIIATLDTEQHYALNTLVVITPKASAIDLSFILALLNSALLSNYYIVFLKSTKRVFSEIQARQVHQLPIRRIDFANPEEKAMHDRLVALVERMLELHRRKADKSLPQSDREDIEREIARTDREIDNLVYDLYGLTEEERRLVEEGTRP